MMWIADKGYSSKRRIHDKNKREPDYSTQKGSSRKIRYNILLAGCESKAFLRLVNLSLADNTKILYYRF